MSFKVVVKNQQGVETNSGTFETQAEADQWVQQCISTPGAFPDNAQITTNDVTALEAAQKLLADDDRSLVVGRAVLVQLKSLNRQKGLAGDALLGLFADKSIISILFMLLTGDLSQAKQAILAVENANYNDQDKALLVSIIDQSGLES